MSGGGSAVILGVPQRAPGLGQAWAAAAGMLGSTAGPWWQCDAFRQSHGSGGSVLMSDGKVT